MDVVLCDRIEFIRTSLGKTQLEMSNDLEISRTVFSDIKRHKVEPSKELIKRIVEKYNINANWLLTGIGEMYLESNDEINHKLCEAINEVFKALNLSLEAFADKLEEEPAYIEKVLNCKADASPELIKKLKDIFDVNEAFLMSHAFEGEKKPKEKDNQKKIDIEKYKKEIQELKALIADMFLEKERKNEPLFNKPESNFEFIDIVGEMPVYDGISAGNGNVIYGDIIAHIPVFAEWMNKPYLKAIRVRGNSMEPKISDGAIAVIDTSDTLLEHNEIGAFVYDHQAYIKLFIEENNEKVLRSLNDTYPDIIIEPNEFFKPVGKLKHLVHLNVEASYNQKKENSELLKMQEMLNSFEKRIKELEKK